MFSQYPERKYERVSYANVDAVLAAFSNRHAVDQFALRLAFSTLVGNADMHLKNWSLIYRDDRTPELAPAYDLLSTAAHLPDDRMALTLGRTKRWDELAVEDFRRPAGGMAVPAAAMVGPALDTVERFPTNWPDHARRLALADAVSAAVERQAGTVPLAAQARARRAPRTKRRRHPRHPTRNRHPRLHALPNDLPGGPAAPPRRRIPLPPGPSSERVYASAICFSRSSKLLCVRYMSFRPRVYLSRKPSSSRVARSVRAVW